MKECSGKKVLKVKVAQNDPLDSSRQSLNLSSLSWTLPDSDLPDPHLTWTWT